MLQAIGSFQLSHGIQAADNDDAMDATEGGGGGGGAADEDGGSADESGAGQELLEARIASKRASQNATVARLKEIVKLLPAAPAAEKKNGGGGGGGSGGGAAGDAKPSKAATAERKRLVAEVTTVNGHLKTSIDEVREVLMDIAALQPLGPADDGARNKA